MRKWNIKWTPLKVKFGVALISLFLFLVLLEISLRLVGSLYFSREIARYDDIKSSNYVILCIGDSFTWGGQVARDQTYPAYLSEIIKSKFPGKKSLVVNKGKCEYNSSQVLRYLPKWLKMYKPNVVVILVGSSNRFNPWGYDSYISKNILSRLKDAFNDFRVVKMMKLIVINLKLHNLCWHPVYIADIWNEGDRNEVQGGGINTVYENIHFSRSSMANTYFMEMKSIKSPSKTNILSSAWYYYNSGRTNRALELLQNALNENPHSPRLLCTMAYMYMKLNSYQKAQEFYSQARQFNPSSEFVLSQTAFFYAEAGNFYEKKGKYDLAVEYFFKAISIDPFEYENYYKLSKAYDFQSKYDAGFIINYFQHMLEDSSGLKNNILFMSYLSLFKDKKSQEGKLDKWLEDDLDKIVTLCRQHNAQVVIQNYPVSYPMANNALRNTAQKYSLPFVDNLKRFNDLSIKDTGNAYLFDDSHCTGLGHRFMAESVSNTLISEKIIQE